MSEGASRKSQTSGKRNVNHRAMFKQRTHKEDNAELTYRLIVTAQKTGELILSSRGLATVPSRVWTINELTKEEIEELRVNIDFESKQDPWWEREPLKKLNLNKNSLTRIDPEIQYLSELVEIDLSNNLLEELPSQIGTLARLKKLNLSCNKLVHLDDHFYKLEELRHLDISKNRLTKLSSSVGDLVMLENLNLSGNNLRILPVGMGYMVRLTQLDLSHNQLEELPPDIMSMRALKKLDASFNELEIVPPLGEMRKVETILMHNNKLSIFPDVTGCASLCEIDLANNNITEIEIAYLEDMPRLRILRLEGNAIKDIPEDIVKLLNLEHLDLSCNKLSCVPNFVSLMPNLKYFGIEGNDVKNVRQDIIRCGAPRLLRHLRQNLHGMKIDSSDTCSLASSIVNCPDKYIMKRTKLLSLTGQNLDQVPESVLQDAISAEVTCIDLSRNRLARVPEKLSMITTATDLKLTRNHLDLIDDSLGALLNLQYLDLNQNALTSLPASMGCLQHLRAINISFNRFTEIPECLYDITKLEVLVANDNQITNINEEGLRNLQRLATLDLSNNNIDHVPPELGNHKHLRNLLLTGNSFKQPRYATIMKGTEEILSYLRDRIPARRE